MTHGTAENATIATCTLEHPQGRVWAWVPLEPCIRVSSTQFSRMLEHQIDTCSCHNCAYPIEPGTCPFQTSGWVPLKSFPLQRHTPHPGSDASAALRVDGGRTTDGIQQL